MGRIEVVLCILGFCAVAATAHTLPEPVSTSGEEADAGEPLTKEEAFQVAVLLLEVAHDLEQDDELNSVTDEYFFRKFWEKTKNATKKYAKKLKEKLKKYGKKAKVIIKEAAKELAVDLAQVAKEKVTEKALEVVSNLIKEATAKYSLEDAESNRDILHHLCSKMTDNALALMQHSQ